MKEPIALPIMEALALELIATFAESCDRIEVAGSVRRLSPWVSDLELVAIPQIEYDVDMFGEIRGETSALDVAINELLIDGTMTVRSGNGPQNKMLVYHGEGEPLPVDIFITTPENWGMTMAVRTGPKDFVKRFMARFQQLGHAGHAYGVARYCNVTHPSHTTACGLMTFPSSVTLHRATVERQEIMCPSEIEVFDLANMNWLDPQYRK